MPQPSLSDAGPGVGVGSQSLPVADDPLGGNAVGAKGRMLRVLYVFAGKRRNGSLEWWLEELALGRCLSVDALDVERDGGHDLTDRRLRKEVLGRGTMMW